MPYTEFHFNSDTNARNPQSTRNRPTYDLRDCIEPKLIQLKELSLPLTWDNVKTGTGFLELHNIVTVLVEGVPVTSKYFYGFRFTVPKGTYGGTEFTEALQAALRASTLVTYTGPEPIPDVFNWGQIFCSLDEDGYILITITPAILSVTVLDFGKIFWGDVLAKYVNRPYTEVNEPLMIVPGIENRTLYPLRMVPNHVYFHSNMMSSCPFNSTALRAQGSASSRTIMNKIMLDSNYEFATQIMPYHNETLAPEFMFTTSGKFGSLEFWFTNEEGDVLDFNNVAFSFTIAMIL